MVKSSKKQDESLPKMVNQFSTLKLGFDRKAYYKRKSVCPVCMSRVSTHHLKRHRKSKHCQFVAFAKAFHCLKVNLEQTEIKS